MQRRASIVAIALLVGLGSWYWLKSVNADEPIEREYLISTDPIVEVLKVRFMGGMSNLSRVYTVFANGRLLLEFVSAVDSEVKRQHEIQLSDEDMDALVSMAVHGGLIEHDHEPFRNEERSYTNHHDTMMWFEMNLERYKGPGQGEWGPASCSLLIKNVHSSPNHFPDVPAFQALATLRRELIRYQGTMEQRDAN